MKIYSPPIITAKGKITYGHGINLVFCDLMGRVDHLSGGNPELLLPCWNNHGLRSEKRASSKEHTEEEILQIESQLEEELKYFGLRTYTSYRDNNPLARQLTQESFLELLRKKFIAEKEDESHVLVIPEIVKNTKFLKHLKETKFHPQNDRIEKTIKDLLNNLNGEYPISKERYFATDVPESQNSRFKINPIFDLSISPLLLSSRNIDYSIEGTRTFLHGTFVPFIIWSGLKDVPFSKNVYLHGYANLDNEFKEKSLKDLADEFGTDVIRFALLTQAGSLEDRTHNRSIFKKGKLTRNKIINLSRYLKIKKVPINLETLSREELSQYKHKNISTIMGEISHEAITLSSLLTATGLSSEIIERYQRLITLISPVMPKAIEEVKTIFSTNN